MLINGLKKRALGQSASGGFETVYGGIRACPGKGDDTHAAAG